MLYPGIAWVQILPYTTIFQFDYKTMVVDKASFNKSRSNKRVYKQVSLLLTLGSVLRLLKYLQLFKLRLYEISFKSKEIRNFYKNSIFNLLKKNSKSTEPNTLTRL